MSRPTWRLKVSDTQGNLRGTYDMGILRIDGAPTAVRDGNGNCVECTWSGDVDVHPRELVEVQWSADDGATWKNIFAGIATSSKSRYGPLGSYKLVGLMKKLEEVEVRKALPGGDLFGRAQILMTDLIASGQVGNLFSPAAVFSALRAGFTSGAVIPNFQHADQVLKTLLAPKLQDVVVAVTADRQLYFGIPTRVPLSIDEITPGVRVTWADVSAEELVTHLRMIWPRPMGGSVQSYNLTLERGKDVYLQNAQAGVTSELIACPVLLQSGVSPPDYGTSVLTLGIILDSSNFRRVPARDLTVSPSIVTGTPATYAVSGTQAALTDADRSTSVTLTPGSDGAGFAVMALALTHSSVPGVPVGVEFAAENVTVSRLVLTDGRMNFIVQLPVGSNGLYLIPDEIRALMAASVGRIPWQVTVLGTLMDTTKSVVIRAYALLLVDPAFSTPLAAAVSRLPAVAAATVTVPGWIDPVPTVALQRRSRSQAPLDVVTLPASYEQTVNAAGQLETTIKLGQRETPDVSATWALIKKRDQLAALNATLVATSSY
jgi:hypothetical protein